MEKNIIEDVKKWNEWYESLSWNQKYFIPIVKLFIIFLLSVVITIVLTFIKYHYIILAIFFVVILTLLYGIININFIFDKQYYFSHFYNIFTQYEKVNEILESKVKNGPKDADNLYYIAIICYELERYAEAEEYFKELIKKYPNHESSYIGLARCYFQQKRFLDAINMYSKVLELDPNNKVAKDELELTNNTFKEIQQKVCK